VTIDVRARVPARSSVQRYGRVLDLQGASRRGMVYEDAALSSVLCRVDREERKGEPLDYVECAECAVVGREIVEWGIERDADVVYFLSEDRGDVAE
jgi:hypothetical protein